MKEFFNNILSNFIFAVVYSFGFVLGKMPRFVHLLFADFIYLLLYRVMGYRVKVTRNNLKNAFPEKSERERKEIERRFYLYLADVFIESIYLVGISKRRMEKKMIFHGIEEFENGRKDKAVIVSMAHYGSWEWGTFYSTMTDSLIVPVYHKLSSPWAEKFYLKVRTRFGAQPVSMNLVGRKLVEVKRKNGILILIADQAPGKNENSEWVTFLNQDTMFFSGQEVLAKKFGMPVYFVSVDSSRRGYYEATFVEIYDGKEELEEFEILRRYQKLLERRIREKPYLWAWSHRRWKRKKPVE